MSRGMYQQKSDREPATCGYCGRTLGAGFSYVCHICGATYCYAHKPDRCDHRKPRPVQVSLLPNHKP